MTSNTVSSIWSKIISVEVLGMLVLMGVAWGSLSTTVDAVATDVEEHSVKHEEELRAVEDAQQQVQQDVHQIGKDVAVIKAKQDNFASGMRKMERTQEKILDILQRQYPNGNGGNN
jgi:peptidoglycan hydrolase CwlO-like protein